MGLSGIWGWFGEGNPDWDLRQCLGGGVQCEAVFG